MTKINETIKAIMNRDGLSYEEAKAQFEATREDVLDALAELDPWDAYENIEDILAGDLGLEMDYIFDFL